MHLISSIVFSILLISTFDLNAATNPIASVIKIRGTVTKLLPGALEASIVSEGDKFPEDTSIVTGPKSFIKIQFFDKSELNMGPESKIIISEMKPDSAGIISLLKGRIRTEVQKSNIPSESAKNKFYIRTRTAAMGVRGTDFQTIYNPENQLTSLLTYNGAVAMAKIDESTHQRFEKGTTTVVRDDSDPKKSPEIKSTPGKLISEKDELVKILGSKETVIVPPGQNAFISSALKKSSLPVKISPQQFSALYKNSEFAEKNLVNLKSGISQPSKVELQSGKQTVPAEGFYNPQTGDFAPKAGGFIDQNTGLYVAPDTSATFDDKNGVYVTTRTGDFDADTGQYAAPKGVILDSKLGFVLDSKTEANPELLALREDLNKSIARDLVVGGLDGEVKLMAKTLKEKYIRNKLSFTIGVANENLKIGSSEVDAKGAYRLQGQWQASSINRFAPVLGINYSAVGYESLPGLGHFQDSKSLFGIFLGLKYALTNKMELLSGIALDQAHYGNLTSLNPASYQFKRIVITKFNLGANYELMRSNEWTILAEGLIKIGFRKRFNDLVVDSNSGYGLKITPQYSLDERRSISLGIFTEFEKVTLTNTLESNSQKRQNHGVELKYNIDLI